MGGISTIGYSYLDHFGGEWESGLGTGPTYVKKDKVTVDNITTFQVKGGGVYNLDDRLSNILAILGMFRNHLSWTM